MNIQKTIKILSSIIILSFLCVSIYLFNLSFRDSQSYGEDKCLKKQKMEFNSVVKVIVDDPTNNKQKLIILNNELKIETYYTNGLWSKLNVNDSVVKKKGDFTVRVFRNNDSLQSFKLNFDIDCK